MTYYRRVIGENGEELGGLVAKDVGKSNRGEVVVGSKVGIRDSENGEGGTVQEIHDEGHGEGNRNSIVFLL